MTANLPWIEKYRPSSLNDLISHADIIHTLDKFVSKGKLPHLLFYGPPGTGKTSTILAIAKQLFGNSTKSCVLELNASDDRGIDVVRTEILNFVTMKSLVQGKLKIVILDEADAMTKDAQNALRRIVEKYSLTTRFCLICNYQNKIIPAIQSRCTRFRFAPLKADQIKPRLDVIIKNENLNVTADGADALIRLGNGDMRQVINILQGCASVTNNVIDETCVYNCVGKPTPADMRHILNILLNSDLGNRELEKFRLEKGFALTDVITELHKLLLRVKFPDEVLVELMTKLADLEKRLSIGCTGEIHTSALAAMFYLVRDKIAAAAK